MEQMPCVPARPHDRQMPSQAVLQHVPCWQRPELHSAAAVHAPPSGFFPQLVAMQVLGEVHSSSFEQTIWQTPFAPHTYGSHGCLTASGHLPSASQRAARVIVEPAHEAAAQVVPTGYLRQAPAPSHTPSRPQLDAPSSGHWSRGSVATSAGAHVPTLPWAAHVMHVPSHAEPQQTPSTQKPLAHSAPAVHGDPATSAGRRSGLPTGTSPPGASPVPIGASTLSPASPFSFNASGRPHPTPARVSPTSRQAKTTRTRISNTVDKARKLYTGRRSDDTGGRRAAPSEIESVLQACPCRSGRSPSEACSRSRY
jgi:hypothetical protein